jgi:two-component system OmpR family response regulator
MKVLVVDDDSNLASTIQQSLAVFAHTVDVAADGADGLFMAKSYDNDAIILDYSMPKKNGLEVCREVRAAGKTTPILFLSNTTDVDLKVQAFKAGADDYITKPFSLEELRARLDAITRRSPQIRNAILAVGSLSLDPSEQSVQHAGANVPITRKEFMLLEYMMRHAGQLLSRTQIMEHVWNADGNPFSNTVEAHIRNLRRKLNEAGAEDMIVNIPGRGYILDAPEKLAKYK